MHLIKELTVPHWNQIAEIRENNSRILHPVQIMNLQVLIKTPINVENVDYIYVNTYWFFRNQCN